MVDASREILVNWKIAPHPENERNASDIAKQAEKMHSRIKEAANGSAKAEVSAAEFARNAKVKLAGEATAMLLEQQKTAAAAAKAESAGADQVGKDLDKLAAKMQQVQRNRLRLLAEAQTAERKAAEDRAKDAETAAAAEVKAQQQAKEAAAAANAQIIEGAKGALDGVVTLAKGFAYFGLVGEKDSKKVVDGLLKIEGGIATLKGMWAVIEQGTATWKAYHQAVAGHAAQSGLGGAIAGRMLGEGITHTGGSGISVEGVGAAAAEHVAGHAAGNAAQHAGGVVASTVAKIAAAGLTPLTLAVAAVVTSFEALRYGVDVYRNGSDKANDNLSKSWLIGNSTKGELAQGLSAWQGKESVEVAEERAAKEQKKTDRMLAARGARAEQEMRDAAQNQVEARYRPQIQAAQDRLRDLGIEGQQGNRLSGAGRQARMADRFHQQSAEFAQDARARQALGENISDDQIRAQDAQRLAMLNQSHAFADAELKARQAPETEKANAAVADAKANAASTGSAFDALKSKREQGIYVGDQDYEKARQLDAEANDRKTRALETQRNLIHQNAQEQMAAARQQISDLEKERQLHLANAQTILEGASAHRQAFGRLDPLQQQRVKSLKARADSGADLNQQELDELGGYDRQAKIRADRKAAEAGKAAGIESGAEAEAGGETGTAGGIKAQIDQREKAFDDLQRNAENFSREVTTQIAESVKRYLTSIREHMDFDLAAAFARVDAEIKALKDGPRGKDNGKNTTN